MGQQRGHQAQQQASKGEGQQREAADGKRGEDPVEAVQEVLGTRAASRQLRAEMQQGNSSQPLHQMVRALAPVSPRSQGKPTFRGVSHEWGGAASGGLVVQPKLMIGEPNDRYEQEADRVAQQVVQQIQSPPVAQTGAGVDVQRLTEEDEAELQRKSESLLLGEAAGGMAVSGELEASIRQARGGGEPLPETVREPMERAFGIDFSGVRIHANAQADQLNQSISAKAFTTGQDVFVRQGAYQPGSREGQELLAHELTHVVQQEPTQAIEKKQIEKQVGNMDVSQRADVSSQSLGGDSLVVQRMYVTKPYTDWIALEPKFHGNLTKLGKVIKAYREAGESSKSAKLQAVVQEMKDLGSIKLLNSQVTVYNAVLLELQQLQNLSPASSGPSSPAPPSTTPGGSPSSPAIATPGPSPTPPVQLPQPPENNLPVQLPPPQNLPVPAPPPQNPPVQPLQVPVQPASQTTGSDPWKSAQLQEDVALLAQHQGKKTYIKAGHEFAMVTGPLNSPKIGPVTRTFRGGVATEVKDKIPHELPGKSGIIFSQGQEGTPYWDPYWTEEKNTEPVSYPKNKVMFINGRNAIKVVDKKPPENVTQATKLTYRNGGQAVLVDLIKDNTNVPSKPGFLVKHFGQRYWVPEGSIEEIEAKYEDRSEIPLFPDGGPKVEHIKQGKIGNCYLMAALASITSKNPRYPQDMMEDNNDGTVTVRLFDVTQSAAQYLATGENKGDYATAGFACTEKYIKVNKSVAQQAGQNLYAEEFLWVQMVEKAYAAGGFRGNLLAPVVAGSVATPATSSFENIEGGKSKFALEILLGREASITSLTQKKAAKRDQTAEIIYQRIGDALQAGKAVTAGTREFTPQEQAQATAEGVGHSAGESKLGGIVAGHAYTVLEVKNNNQIKLRNPWGEYGRQLAGTVVKDGDGTVEMSMNEFLNWFSSLDISGRVELLRPN